MMQARATQSTSESFVPLHADSLHDLAGPVNQISTMLELFLKRQSSRAGTEPDSILDLIRDAAGRLQKLMLAMQEFDRLAGVPLNIRSCEGGALLALALASVEAAIRQAGADLEHGEL